jgi:hypothetical protein
MTRSTREQPKVMDALHHDETDGDVVTGLQLPLLLLLLLLLLLPLLQP